MHGWKGVLSLSSPYSLWQVSIAKAFYILFAHNFCGALQIFGCTSGLQVVHKHGPFQARDPCSGRSLRN